MSLARKFAVVLVATLLTTTLVTASVVGAAHLTVLDPDFVTNSIEEEGGYEMVQEMTSQAAGSAAETNDTTSADPADPGEATGPSGAVDPSALLEDAITEEYVRTETEANVDRLYAYLHGDRDDLNLSISTAPIRSEVSAAVTDRITNASIGDLLAQSNASLEGPVDRSTLRRMTESQSSYRDVKNEFRADVRERVLDAAVDEAFENRTDDELLDLVVEEYDPSEYSEEEKARMVADLEREIRTALRDRIESENGDEIDERVDEELATLREEATGGDPDTEAEAAAANVSAAVVTGLTTDTSYQEFSSDLSAAKAELAGIAAARAEEQIADEMPARLDLTETMDEQALQSFEGARTGVQWLDRLAFVLPVVAIGLVGLLYYLRRSVALAASGTGWSMLAAGVPLFLGVQLGMGQLQSLFADAQAGPDPALDVLLGVVGRVANTVGDVALALTVGGILLVAGSLAVRYGLLDRLREQFGDGGAGPDTF